MDSKQPGVLTGPPAAAATAALKNKTEYEVAKNDSNANESKRELNSQEEEKKNKLRLCTGSVRFITLSAYLDNK